MFLELYGYGITWTGMLVVTLTVFQISQKYLLAVSLFVSVCLYLSICVCVCMCVCVCVAFVKQPRLDTPRLFVSWAGVVWLQYKCSQLWLLCRWLVIPQNIDLIVYDESCFTIPIMLWPQLYSSVLVREWYWANNARRFVEAWECFSLC